MESIYSVFEINLNQHYTVTSNKFLVENGVNLMTLDICKEIKIQIL